MLVCPHCQFENPDTNKFCQQCGGVLAATCPSNGLPFQAASPIEHDEFGSQVYLAVISNQKALSGDREPLEVVTPETPEAQNTEAAPTTAVEGTIGTANIGIADTGDTDSQPTAQPNPGASTSSLLSPQPDGCFLDRNGRYQLLSPTPDLSSITQELEVYVLDHQPGQRTALQSAELQSDEPSADVTELTVDWSTIPRHVRPYLELQQNHPSLRLPELHDAWEQDGYWVTLLKHQMDLPLLTDVCQDETILPLQILYWLHEMVEYWAVLQPYQQCQSLLRLDNLRVDPEDCVLRLQRLYTDSPDAEPSLKNLGWVWQQLFEQTQRTQPGDLFLLCRDLESCHLTTIHELRSRIEDIAERLQHPVEPSAPAPALLTNSFEIAALEETDYSSTAGLSLALDETEEELAQPTDLGELGEEDSDDQPTVVLPMQLISIDDAGRTITGRQRDHNEDSFYIQTEVKRIETKKLDDSQERVVQAKGLYILCDGMGGHAGGEVASALAVETLRQYFEEHWQDKLPNEKTIREAIYLANQAIYKQNQENSRMGSGRMGTTLVLLLLHNADVAIAHVGDSRLYHLSRRRGLEQLTVDHEVGQREIQRGVEPSIAYARPDAYQLTQALGPRDEGFINPDISFFELNEDALLLLCSDGVTDNDLLEMKEHRSYLDSMLDIQTNLEQGINNLIDLANQFNGHDNITAIGIRVRVRPNLSQVNRS